MKFPTQVTCISCCLFINLSILIIDDLTIALRKTFLKSDGCYTVQSMTNCGTSEKKKTKTTSQQDDVATNEC